MENDEAEKRRRILGAVIAISMDSLRTNEAFTNAQAEADWADIGGPAGGLTPQDVDRLAPVFGCPENRSDEKD